MPDTEVTIEYMIPLFVVVRHDKERGLHIAKVVVYDDAAPLRLDLQRQQPAQFCDQHADRRRLRAIRPVGAEEVLVE